MSHAQDLRPILMIGALGTSKQAGVNASVAVEKHSIEVLEENQRLFEAFLEIDSLLTDGRLIGVLGKVSEVKNAHKVSGRRRDMAESVEYKV